MKQVNLNVEEIAAKGIEILNEKETDFASLSTENKLTNLATVLVYEKMVSETISKVIKLYEDSIDIKDFNGTYKVGNRKVTFNIEDSYTGKALGLTNKKLKEAYNIDDSIISIETKEMVSLKKDKLYEAYVAKVPEVCNAVRDGKLSQPTSLKTKTSTVSTVK